MSARAGKRPMRSLTANEKLEAIRRVHDGESKASVARDIGVPESTLRGWCKNEDKISYLSRQSSSPETDESVEPHNKRARLDDAAMQPFNLSLKTNGGNFSPNSESKNEADASKSPLNNLKQPDGQKPIDHATERERNKAELARMSVELGLNRPEMFLSNINNGNANLAELSTLAHHWNALFLHQQQKIQLASKGKVTAAADTSTHAGLLTTVDQEKSKHLPKEQQSVNEAIWYWLHNQKLTQGQNPVPNVAHANGASSSTTTIPTSVNSMAAANGLNNDTRKWFWNWYKLAYSQQPQQFPPTGDTAILYQQLTKDATQRLICTDQQNSENRSTNDEKSAADKTNNNHNKVRSVLDNILSNSNIIAHKRDSRSEEDKLSGQKEAVEHGEKFLKWLESCSDPSVSTLQIVQFKSLLNTVKTVANEHSNGDLQDKTKGKRKGDVIYNFRRQGDF